MALTAFDGNFSFRQEELARLGGHEPSSMTKEQWLEFQNSPFMKSMKQADEICLAKNLERDGKRRARDPEFEPDDADWKADKSFQYDKGISYYRVLGVDELASLAEVREAYKKLSLIFHPDKTAGMTTKEKEEYGTIFIEIKNAYKTLSDAPTRRQLDRDRDRELSVQEVNGWKPKVKKSFDATELLKKMQQDCKNPGKTIDIPLAVRLEKFFWGGQKGMKRERRVKDFTEFVTEEKMFRLDVAKGAPDPLPIILKDAGDHQEDTRPDTLRFVVSSKPHAVSERQGDDLVVRQPIALRADAHMQPYLSGDVEVLRGRQVVFWGRNPFFRSTGSGAGELRVRLRGEGFGAQGSLRLTAKLGAGAGGAEKIVIRLKQIQTGAEMALRMPKEATMGDAMAKAGELLDFLGSQKVQIMKAEAGGHVPYADETPIGSLRSLECGGTQWSEVPLSADSAASLLHSLIGITETEVFRSGLAEAYARLEASLIEARTKVNELWQLVADVLPDFGFQATVSTLEKVVEKAIAELEGDDDALCARCKGIAVGFDPDAYEAQGKVARKAVGLAGHPVAVDRAKARMRLEPVCDVVLSPLLREPVVMSTKPACFVTFYSNARQAAAAPLGQAQPRLFFAATIASFPGSKKGQREEWTELMGNLGPLLRDSLFCVLRAARGILPRPLAAAAAFPDGDYAADADVVVTAVGEKTPWERLDEEEGDDDEEGGGGGGGGMFGFDDDEDEDEAKADDDDSDAGGGGMFDFDDMEEAAAKKAEKAKKAEEKRRASAGKRSMSVIIKREALAEERRKAALEKSESASGGSGVGDAMPWKELGNRAFRRGDCYLAASYYSKHLAEQPEGGGDAEATAAVLTSRSACLTQVGHFEAAYDDAKAALERKEQWGKAWAALGAAASERGEDFAAEARSAYFEAARHDPSGPNVEALEKAVTAAPERGEDKASEKKGEGNVALEAGDLGLAIANYTHGIGLAPEEEASGLLLAALLSNRCLAFMKRRDWDLAIVDGRRAVAACKTHPPARLRLGTALLGVGKSEEAYSEFAFGLRAEPGSEQLKKAQATCLSLMPLWRSTSAMARMRTRFGLDANRPKGSTKVFAMSDLHYDHKRNDEWVHAIDEFQFKEDVMIVAGNVADTFASLVRCLKALKSKFRRVFFTPGNHEFWIHPSESDRFPDSIAKLHAILDACDQLEVDVFPAPICEDCSVVPLFSWYNAEYDDKDPFPDAKSKFDAHCAWPMDVDQQVWRFFLELNLAHIDLPYGDTVITFSHFLPRQGLPFDSNVPRVAKAMGCEELDEQLRHPSLNAKLHIHGHSRKRHAKIDAGVTYVQHSLGYDNEHTDLEPFMCVYNGQSISSRTVPICSS